MKEVIAWKKQVRKKEGGARNVQPTTTLTLRKGGERKGSDERTKITMTRVVTAAEMINGLFARYRSVEDRGSEIKGKKEKKGGRKKERMDPMGAKAENCTKFRNVWHDTYFHGIFFLSWMDSKRTRFPLPLRKYHSFIKA